MDGLVFVLGVIIGIALCKFFQFITEDPNKIEYEDVQPREIKEQDTKK